MKWLRGLASLIAYLCAATFLAELLGLLFLFTQTHWDHARRERLVAAIYGLGLPTPEPPAVPVEPPESQRFQERVQAEALLKERQAVFNKDIQSEKRLTEIVKIERDEEDVSRKALQDFLVQSKQQAEVQGLTTLRTTLESLPPKQSKDILVDMLAESPAQVTSLLKAMPLENTKKIFKEFKTPEEAEQLHRILLELGEFASRPSSETTE